MMAEGVEEVSAATKAILATGVVSALLVVLWAASLVVRLLLSVLPARATTAAGGKRPAAGKAPAKEAREPAAAKAGGQRGPDLKSLIKESQRAQKSALTKEDMAAHHSLFLTTCRHGDAVHGVAWSPDGKLLATACDDLTLRVFDLQDVTAKDPKFRSVRTPQAPLACGFGGGPAEVVAVVRDIPDSARLTLFTVSKGKGNVVTFQQEWDAGRALDREPLLQAAVVPSAQSAAGAGVAVLLSVKKFGRVFRLSDGKPIGTFEPNSLGNHALAVSADGRFIAVASFSSEVKVWEIQHGRDGLKGVARALDLKGHARKVMSVAISPNGTRAATASEDGSLRVWKLDVRYHLQEDAKTLLTVPLTDLGLGPGQAFSRMAWGPDGTVAAAAGPNVHFFTAASGRLLEKVHAHEEAIAGLAWAPAALDVGGGQRAAVLATCSGDRRVRVWRSPVEADV